MEQHNLKKITVVPSRKDLIDIILSRTTRRTPYINLDDTFDQIRYICKCKVHYTQIGFCEKLSTIINEFPCLDGDGDLMHVLYDKDRCRHALRQIYSSRNFIRKIGKYHVGLIAYGDSIRQCKTLKVAALGRMCNVIKRIGPSLDYLEQTRQHMDKLDQLEQPPCIPQAVLEDDEWEEDNMSELEPDPSAAINHARSRSVLRGRKRDRSVSAEGDTMDVDKPKKKLRTMYHSRYISRFILRALKIVYKSTKKRNKQARRGEADHVSPTLSLKHLFSGKRGTGRTGRS